MEFNMMKKEDNAVLTTENNNSFEDIENGGLELSSVGHDSKSNFYNTNYNNDNDNDNDNSNPYKDIIIHKDQNQLIEFHPSSNQRPKNWSLSKKLIHTALYGFITFAAQFNSTTMSSNLVLHKLHQQFGISREVSLIATSLYILGIALGPMVFAPLSEVYGRKIGVFVPFFISCLFTFATSISYNVAALMVTRFVAGFFAGAPIVSAGGVMGDIFQPESRGAALAFYGCFVVNGAALGPTIASLLVGSVDRESSWRIAQWFSGLLDLVLLFVCTIWVQETYEPVLIARVAKRIRLNTDNWEIHSKLDMWKLDIHGIVTVHLFRPFQLLASPIVFLMALYASYVGQEQ
ncbi:unnamed protein product [Ambrosiozyma monospora]|uniref:Unnamed protein product n=1 Tax=Ambrosiozyma monospora TaxID=43982 RepID=A0A9W6Z017_AMBMO|nr:unnamed protein product [Ambrosiozyma monospora]